MKNIRTKFLRRVYFTIFFRLHDECGSSHRSYGSILHVDLLENRGTLKLRCKPASYFYALDFID